MTKVAQTGLTHIPIGRFMLAGMLLWTIIVGYSLAWNAIQVENQVEYLAKKEAIANWNKDLAFRRWATLHGGLYVKPDERTPPNPYLTHLPERDVVTTDGMELTLMNPAYMLRQIAEEFEDLYGVKGSISGLRPLNPDNMADEWEQEAISRFKQGEEEIISITEINGEPHLRLMRPMMMDKGCLKCHEILNFKAGDIGGGISVSIPLTPYKKAAKRTIWQIISTHSFVWLLGMLFIFYVVQRGKQYEAERTRHEQAIKNIATGVSNAAGDAFFHHLVEHMATIFGTKYALIGKINKNNPEKISTLAIYACGKIIDNIEYPLENTPCANVLKHGICIYPEGVQQLFPDDKMLKSMSIEGYSGRALLDSHDKLLGILVVMDNKPLQHTNEMSELLEIFAARASGELERLSAEQALRRSQKMDAIDQLSGGIAHDFNNQLGIILGYLDFLKSHTEGDEKASRWVEIASNATLRCTDLTRQLLSFSRTQSNEKIVVNINAKLEEMKNMLTRSITPAIEIQYLLDKKLWLTEIDPGEFQDAILNMVINARDAMPNGGKLLIETSNKKLDAECAKFNPNAQAGDYIQLVLSDTGCGMDKVTQEHIFEPFYTTKSKDKGTGLGMSMVYGFVKRFNGFIQIYSEVGIGTTLRIYLPRATANEAVGINETGNDQNMPTGTETILIVDDELDLLHLADDYLTSLGYKTRLAENASQALAMLEKHKDIDCMFSDVVMPGGMNGYELAEQASKNNPELKILLTSGFTSKTIAKNAQIRFSVQMLSKPYRKTELAQHLRQVLDEAPKT